MTSDATQPPPRLAGIANLTSARTGRPSGKPKSDRNDPRSEGQRDKDRILYSSAWRRLGGVTQVITPFDDGALLHNRLTHSEKVTQVARSIGERLLADASLHSALRDLGGFDVEVCEAAAMAHDLGHPPFGHIGEEVLDRLARNVLKLPDGFEGNAQSLRIVSIGKVRSARHEGLDLSWATLAAISKYPWERATQLADDAHKKALSLENQNTSYRRRWKKFNFYHSQADLLQKSREFVGEKIGAETQTLEASVMDAADDISYAVHDLEDFYLSGILNTAAVVDDLRSVFDSRPGGGDAAAFRKLSARLAVDYPDYYDENSMHEAASYVSNYLSTHFRLQTGSALVEAQARQAGSRLVGRYIAAVTLSEAPLWENGPHIGLERSAWHEVQILKEITRSYVIQRPDIALLQRGQQRVLEELVSMLAHWVKSREDRHRLPQRLLDEVQIAEGLENGELAEGYDEKGQARRGATNRAILDYLCTLGDQQCLSLYYKLSGIQVHRIGMQGAF